MSNTLITKICPNCRISFSAVLAEHNRGGSIYCSRKCFGLARRAKPKKEKNANVFCAYCKKPFYKRPSTLVNSKSGLYFCCREHKDISQRIGGIEEIQPDHYGTIGNTHKARYRDIAFRDKEKECEICGYNKYVEVLQIHHKDCNRMNNAIENLIILCPTCHIETHFLSKSGFWSKTKTTKTAPNERAVRELNPRHES